MIKIPRGKSGETALVIAQKIAKEAGSLILNKFYGAKEISVKGINDVVTDADKASEKLMRSLISAEYPEMGFLGEESGGAKINDGFVWIVDPIDGTRNYARGIPFFSLVIGLSFQGNVLLGVTYDPIREEMFYAQQGRGAYLNSERIQVSNKEKLSECLLGFDLSYTGVAGGQTLDVVSNAWGKIAAARLMGSSALGLAYVACGRYDIYIHPQLSPWDQIAGILLIQEAGGQITDRYGNTITLDSTGVLSANKTIHRKFYNESRDLQLMKDQSDKG